MNETSVITVLFEKLGLLGGLAGVAWLIGKRLLEVTEARISDMKDRIGAIERVADECSKDRAKLWEKLSELKL